MNDADRVGDTVHEAGLDARRSPHDTGTVRLYTRGASRALVGLVTVRAGRATYAEIRGRVFPFWPNGDLSHDTELDQLLEQIRTTAC